MGVARNGPREAYWGAGAFSPVSQDNPSSSRELRLHTKSGLGNHILWKMLFMVAVEQYPAALPKSVALVKSFGMMVSREGIEPPTY